MRELDLESRLMIKTILAEGVKVLKVGRLLEVAEGAVGYHVRRIQRGPGDGMSLQSRKAEAVATAIAHWRDGQRCARLNMGR